MYYYNGVDINLMMVFATLNLELKIRVYHFASEYLLIVSLGQ